MSALDQAIAAVEESNRLDAGKKELVKAFLRMAGPVVMELGEEGLNAAMGAAAIGGDVAGAVVANLDAQGVATLLAVTEREMAGMAQWHEAQAQAAKAAVETLQAAALGALARALLGML